MNKHPVVAPEIAQPLLWNTHHDQPESRRRVLIALLNQHLADLVDLGLQARQAHWNVKGPQFSMLHALFAEVARQLADFADMLAQRAVVLGGTALGTSQVVARATRLPAYPLDAFDGPEHLWPLSAALAWSGRALRVSIATSEQTGDAGTAAVFTQISRCIDTLLWHVEAHIALEPGGAPSPAIGRTHAATRAIAPSPADGA